MNFTIPATSITIIKIVVSAIAICAIVTVVTLSICMMRGVRADPTLITAYVGITTGSLGALTGLLANTRSTPGTDADMPKAVLEPVIKADVKLTTDKPTI